MRAIKRKNTSPELRLRSELHRRGCRFRVDFPVPVSGSRPPRPDIAFPRLHLAIFVDGCFWHGCPEHGRAPRRNQAYWGPKIDRNVERDREQEQKLAEADWTVLRFWEHVDPVDAADEIEDALAELCG